MYISCSTILIVKDDEQNVHLKYLLPTTIDRVSQAKVNNEIKKVCLDNSAQERTDYEQMF